MHLTIGNFRLQFGKGGFQRAGLKARLQRGILIPLQFVRAQLQAIGHVLKAIGGGQRVLGDCAKGPPCRNRGNGTIQGVKFAGDA